MMDDLKWVYNFSSSSTEGRREMKNLLGGKGANLAEMSSLNLPVPPGFTLTTEACIDFYKNDEKLRSSIEDQVLESLKKVESLTGKKFGDVGKNYSYQKWKRICYTFVYININ